MFVASLRIRRQLARTDDAVRWASVIAGPTEFWTITVWRTRHDMQEFMRSGAHDDIMWLFSRWLRSFWLMRWRPAANEVGAWQGLTLAPAAEPAGGPAPQPPAGDALRAALEHLPWLQAATGPDGAAHFDDSPSARKRRAEVGAAGGLVVHVHTPPLRMIANIRSLRACRAALAADGELLRASIGVGKPGDAYLLCVWRDGRRAAGAVHSPALGRLVARWPGRVWANEWVPENEFGHWDGARLRQRRARSAIDVPADARRAAE